MGIGCVPKYLSACSPSACHTYLDDYAKTKTRVMGEGKESKGKDRIGKER